MATDPKPVKMVKHNFVVSMEARTGMECLSPSGTPWELVPEGDTKLPLRSTTENDNAKYPNHNIQKFATIGKPLK
jgi:hypothetical protein